jgi:hypothetical protein
VSQDVEIDLLAERGEVHDAMSALLRAVTYKAPAPSSSFAAAAAVKEKNKKLATLMQEKTAKIRELKKHTVRTNGRYVSVYDTLVGLGLDKKQVARFWVDMMAEFPVLRANVVSLATEQGPGRPTPMLSPRFIDVLVKEFNAIAEELGNGNV